MGLNTWVESRLAAAMVQALHKLSKEATPRSDANRDTKIDATIEWHGFVVRVTKRPEP